MTPSRDLPVFWGGNSLMHPSASEARAQLGRPRLEIPPRPEKGTLLLLLRRKGARVPLFFRRARALAFAPLHPSAPFEAEAAAAGALSECPSTPRLRL